MSEDTNANWKEKFLCFREELCYKTEIHKNQLITWFDPNLSSITGGNAVSYDD